MTTIKHTVTAEMIEKAAQAEWTHEWPIRPWEKVPDDLADHYRDCSRAALEAAAPLIAAQALRDVADEVYGDERAQGPYAEPLSVASWLRSRADEIEAGR